MGHLSQSVPAFRKFLTQISATWIQRHRTVKLALDTEKLFLSNLLLKILVIVPILWVLLRAAVLRVWSVFLLRVNPQHHLPAQQFHLPRIQLTAHLKLQLPPQLLQPQIHPCLLQVQLLILLIHLA